MLREWLSAMPARRGAFEPNCRNSIAVSAAQLRRYDPHIDQIDLELRHQLLDVIPGPQIVRPGNALHRQVDVRMQAKDFGVDDRAEGDNAGRLILLPKEGSDLARDGPRLFEARGSLLPAECLP